MEIPSLYNRKNTKFNNISTGYFKKYPNLQPLSKDTVSFTSNIKKQSCMDEILSVINKTNLPPEQQKELVGLMGLINPDSDSEFYKILIKTIQEKREASQEEINILADELNEKYQSLKDKIPENDLINQDKISEMISSAKSGKLSDGDCLLTYYCILNNEDMYSNKEALNYIAQNDLCYPTQLKLVSRVFNEDKLKNNKVLMKEIERIVFETTHYCQMELVNKILDDEKFYGNPDTVRALSFEMSLGVLCHSAATDPIINELDKILNDKELYNNDNLIKNLNYLVYYGYNSENTALIEKIVKKKNGNKICYT